MASCRCKMCGGQINYESNQTTATCEFCGTEQTVVRTDDTKKANLHNRANSLRRANEFDKALATYESILIDNPKDAEAHWGICLCRYGIEYVDDPKTKKKIPTCHRTVYNSIFDDIDYKEAIANCDVIAKRIYQAEADVIDKIQKTILSISQKEDPYDIFICYKESDENGNRTKDSVIAQEIYDALIEKGYKVFFARITLESKLGTQYEPIIFAALQSSKVMLAIGSKVEYYNAPWVKNEWSRFLSFMKEQRGKYLIPCYKDMEAYDMPDEFLSLQAQNIDKLGFLQDLVRGIDKIFGRKEKKTDQNITINTTTNIKYLNLLKRAKLSIEDKEYKKASTLIEEVLNENAECAEAYVALILIEFELTKEDDLMNLSEPLDQNKHYIKALRFADESYKSKLISYNEQIKNKIDLANKERIYLSGKNLANQKKYNEAITVFESIKGFKDTEDLIEFCTQQIQSNIYLRAMNYFNSGSYDLAHKEFSRIIQYKDSELFIERCKQLSEEKRKEGIYNTAISKIEFVFSNAKESIDESSFKTGVNLLKDIIDFKDSKDRITKYEKRLADLKEKIAKEKEEKRKEAERIAILKKEKEEKERIERINRDKIRKDKFKRFLKFFIPSATLLTIVLVLIFTLFIPMAKYNNAMELINSGKYDEAELVLEDIGDFKDAETQIKLMEAREYFEEGNYESGIDLVYEAGGEVNITYNTDGGTSEKTNEVIKKLKRVDNDCEKPGYDFYGWIIENFAFSNKNYSVDLTLKATYEIITYNISFDFNGGNKQNYPSTYTVISDDIVISNPTRKGYTFVGWTMARTDEPVKDLVIKTGSVGNREYTAHWEANTYTITYDWNNSKDYFTYQDVVYDSKFTLTVPTREGYKFSGWADENGLYFEEGYYIIDNDITLTAQWELNQYNITYIMNGGTNNINNPSIYNYENDPISLNEPTKNGYTFIGWTGENYIEPTLVVEIPAHSVNNRTYTAHWEANTYTATYDVNGGNALSKDEYQYTFDSTYTLPSPTREGYSFAGWYYEDDLVESGKWKISEDCTLVAEWTIIEYDLYYDLDGGTNNNSNPSNYTYETNDIVFASPERVGYTFVGWTSVNQTTPTIDLVLPHNSIQDRTITAHWEANTYTITYDVNGGNALSKDTQDVLYDDYYTLLVPTRSGYTFVCWEYNGSAFNAGQWIIANDVELIAKWERITYNITYYLDGGTNNNSNPSTYNYDCDDIILNSPEKEGYTFVGWTSLTNNEPVIEPVIEKNSTGNKIFTAHWEANTYTITYDVNGGNALSKDTQDIIFDGSYSLSIPSRTGYTFAGWYYNNSLVSNTGIWKISENCELEAKWTANKYTITIITSSSSKTYTATYDSSYTLTTQSKSGYYFDGYFLEQYGQGVRITDAYGKSIVPYTYTKNITVYASFVYDVDFITNGGEEVETVTYHENEYLDSTIVTTKEGKTFGGWYTNSELTSAVSYSNSLGNKTLYARWEEEVLPSELAYITSNGATTISGSTYTGTDLIIPSHIGGVPVTIISGSAFANMTSITTVEVPITVTSIGTGAFKGCYSIEKITLPFVGQTAKSSANNDTYMYPFGTIFGTSSYSNATETLQYYKSTLKSDLTWNTTTSEYYIPDSLKVVNITLQENINYGAFYNCSKLVEINIPATTNVIEAKAFYGCKALQRLNSDVDGVINIPENVTSISDYAFYGCSTISEVNIGDNISYIGIQSFYECSNIVKFNSDNPYNLVVPNGCTTLGKQAFYKLNKIKKVIVSDSVSSMGWYVFDRMTSLEELTIPYIPDIISETTITLGIGYLFTYSSSSITGMYSGGANDSYYRVPTSLQKIVITNDETIPDYAFYNMTSLVEVSTTDNLTYVGKYSFRGCSALSKLNSDVDGVINIPENVTSISDYAFYGCSTISEVNIGDNISYIGIQSFYECSNIVKFNSDNPYDLVVPNGCTTLGKQAFYKLNKIKKVTVSDSVSSMGWYVFDRMISLEELTIPFIPETTTKLGIGYLFTYSSSSVTGMYSGGANDWYYLVPNTLTTINVTRQTTIPDYAFYDMTSLVEVVLPENVTYLGQYAFYNCKNLKRLNRDVDGVINIPENVTSISDYAFYGCSTVAEIYYSDNVTYIGTYAFAECKNVVKMNSSRAYELNVSSNCEKIGSHAFSNMNKIKYANIYDGIITLQSRIFDRMTSLEELTIPFIPETTTTKLGIGYLFTYSSSSITGMYSGGANDGYYRVPTSLQKIVITNDETILDYAFYNMTSLVEVVLPENVTYLGQYAFYNCKNLKRLNSNVDGVIEIPTKVHEINDYTFYNCSVISDIRLSQNVEFIGDYAFYGCSNVVKFNSNNPYELIVPNECGVIETYAFYGMSLIKTATLPNSLYSIGSSCLGNMISLETLSVPYISDNSDSKLGIGRIFTYSSSSVTGMYSGGANSSYYRVPNTLTTINVTRQTTIPDYAFYNMTKLVEINLRVGTTVNSNTFKNCSATINYILQNPIYFDENTVWDGKTISEGFKQGIGTKEDPFIISNSIEFAYFVSQVNLGNTYSNTYFKLTNDINLNKKNFDSIKEFNGYFDGNGYTIKNVNLHNSNEYSGLFHKLGEDGYIVNLTVKFNEMTITDNTIIENNYVGPLVAFNNGVIQNCYVEGTISTTVTNSIYIGGIVGYNNGTISDSFSNVQINSISNISYSYAGGIIGYNNGTINDCLAIANVSSKGLTIAYSFVGGILGYSTTEELNNLYVLDTQTLTKYETQIESINDYETSIKVSQIKDSLGELWDLKYWDFDYKYPRLIK